MGWAITYTVKWGRPLTEAETTAFKDWSQKHQVFLEPTATGPELESWRGLVPDDVFERMAKQKAEPGPKEQQAAGVDYSGFLSLQGAASFRKAVRLFQELEALFPFAEILLSDDYHLEQARPSGVDLKNLPVRGETEGRQLEISPPPVPDDAQPAAEPPPSPEAQALRDEIEQVLERARKDFAIWKNRAKK